MAPCCISSESLQWVVGAASSGSQRNSSRFSQFRNFAGFFAISQRIHRAWRERIGANHRPVRPRRVPAVRWTYPLDEAPAGPHSLLASAPRRPRSTTLRTRSVVQRAAPGTARLHVPGVVQRTAPGTARRLFRASPGTTRAKGIHTHSVASLAQGRLVLVSSLVARWGGRRKRIDRGVAGQNQ